MNKVKQIANIQFSSVNYFKLFTSCVLITFHTCFHLFNLCIYIVVEWFCLSYSFANLCYIKAKIVKHYIETDYVKWHHIPQISISAESFSGLHLCHYFSVKDKWIKNSKKKMLFLMIIYYKIQFSSSNCGLTSGTRTSGKYEQIRHQ